MICNDNDSSFSSEDRLIRVPNTVDCLQGLINVIPLQLLSYHLAVMGGVDVELVFLFPFPCLSLKRNPDSDASRFDDIVSRETWPSQ